MNVAGAVTEAVSPIDAAAGIGRALCANAYWHEGRCNWTGRSPREAIDPGMPIVPTVTALGPELYTGTAGIALFLAQLHAETADDVVRRTALGAMRQALWKSDDLPATASGSFYGGRVGIGYAAVRVGLLLDEADLVGQGIRLARRAVAAADGGRLLDVIGGNAGAIAPLLWLATLPGGAALQNPLLDLAAELAAAATKQDGTWCWDNDRACGKGVGQRPLCGFAHGASGMGLALIESGVRHRQRDWIDGGLAAFRYEDRLYDPERGNWPDLRDFAGRRDAPHPAKPSAYMVAWCHGAAGIGLARLRAYRLLPEHRAELQTGVERAVRCTAAHLQALPADADASPCHGRAGLAETLLYAASVLDDRQHADRVLQMWTGILGSRAADAPWPCGVASGRNNPSLMLGHAGIGYALLRATDPGKVPSMLVIEPDR